MAAAEGLAEGSGRANSAKASRISASVRAEMSWALASAEGRGGFVGGGARVEGGGRRWGG